MTPEERQMLTSLAERLRGTSVPQKDSEAEGIIRDLVAAKPDTPYVLTQTVLVQDYALRNAKAQIDALQRQLDDAREAASRQAQPRSFLSGLFGGGTPAPSVPQSGPWGGQQAAPPPNYAYQQPQPQPQPAYASGGVQQPSFLQGAARTAVGVAGGALLFEGIESLFGGHQGGGFLGGGYGGSPWGGGMMPQETVNETVVNNYYDNNGPNDPGFDNGNFDSGMDNNAGFDDTSFDDGGNDGGFF